MAKTAWEAMEELAYQKIWELVLHRRLIPGQKIVYRDLENLLQMSKTPILHALTRLKHELVVVAIHNRGYYMRVWEPKDVFQMFEVKTKIYDIVVDYALPNCTAAHLVKLRKAMETYSKYNCDVYDATKFSLDLAFHLPFVEMTNNAYLTSILEQQYRIMASAIDLSLFTPFLDRFDQDHLDILDALERHDARAAKRVLRAHNRIGQTVVVREQKRARSVEPVAVRSR